MLGLLFKIGFRRRPDEFKSKVGQIVGFALFASKQRNLLTTSLSIAALLLRFGSSLRSGLVFMAFNLAIGQVLVSKIGGADWRRDQHLNLRHWHH
jgi:hypothetical protein